MDQVRILLPEASATPVSTSALAEQLGILPWQPQREALVRVLDLLAKLGLVEKIKPEGQRQVFWRRARSV